MLVIDLFPYTPFKVEKRIPTYPYISYEFVIVFVYGTDFERQKYHILNSSEAFVGRAILAFFFFAAAVLCYVRRINRLRRDGYSSSFIDTVVTFIGGGNLQMNHKLERWIFGILLIGCFFLSTFWFEVMFPSFLLSDKKIKTFDDLIKINPTIYIPNSLHFQADRITDMLRYHLFH